MKYLISLLILSLGFFGSTLIYHKLKQNYVLGAQRIVSLDNQKIWDDLIKDQVLVSDSASNKIEKSMGSHLNLYDIRLFKENEIIYEKNINKEIHWSEWGQSKTYEFAQKQFQLEVKPTKSYLNVLTSQVPKLILFFCFVLSFILALLILFVQYFYEKNEALKTAKQEISEKNKLLTQSNYELEQYVYAASHDLQEPINTILCFLDILDEDHGQQLQNDSIQQYLCYIKNASEQMKNLVEGLLTHSQIGLGEKKSSVAIQSILEEAICDLTHRIKKTKAEIIFPAQLPEVIGYRMELKRLFQNLLSNAIKYQHKNAIPVINIISKPDKKGWHFIVKDNGIGIDPNNRDKIFDLFQRLHHKSKYKGTGIGLAHCKKIVALHQGEIWVDSHLGKGSEFHFILPYS